MELKEKTLTPAELHNLREFVLEVLSVCQNDFDQVTCGLEELAEMAGEILGMKPYRREEE